MHSTDNTTRRRLAYVAVGFVTPTLVTLIAVVVQIMSMSDLPDEVAVHWNASGDADRWGSPWVMVVAAIVSGLIAVGISAVNYRVLRDGATGGTFRWLSTASAALATALAVVFAGALASQTDGDTSSPVSLIGAAAIAAAVVGAIGWYVQPSDPPADPGSPAEPMGLAPGHRAVWLHTETASRAILVLTGLLLGFAVVVALVTWTNGGAASAFWAAVVIIVVAAAAVATIVGFHVRIDSSGLTLRSIAGIPRWHVPADDIEDVSVIDIRAIGDFGGYGIRLARGRTGIVLRSGPAVLITRVDGRPLVITLSDAATAAALLAVVAVRARD
ncbi:DUF1648 domain-containing protein [Gordonia sp. HY002]|uniref:DUF1648 domain-containing protein n=1 Tax=Gordonia zhenghanii TaxID=2911516 RepID=UPI001EEF9FFA|nr:DUF1648 domain-containing protein [Gordonia zhenghanii]MCF8571364.1 DUF1648 domain-containing protein [Gordonia zhenghanii]MCF8604876.1 DUF1648 domain-containing protein [Gordonia zhenghanii]